jgi:parallel beta-helix repeat protein
MRDPRLLWGSVLVAIMVAVAWNGGSLASLRPVAPEFQTSRTIEVVTPIDSGVGSLREAMFEAARERDSVRIRIRTSRIDLLTPLPPLMNPHGVIIDSEAVHCRIDAKNIGRVPVFDVTAPRSVIAGVRIEHAAASAILIRASAAQIRNVTIADCEEGIHIADHARGVTVENSTLDRNGIGIVLLADAAPALIRGNTFRNHDHAAIWAVSDRPHDSVPVRIANNHFDHDRMGVVDIHVRANIERNEFVREAEAALYLMGTGAAVRNNRVREGKSIGIFADGTETASIESNEIDRNVVGVLLRSARDTVARLNRIYANGYGVAIAFGNSGTTVVADNLISGQTYDGFYVLGAAPMLRNNVVSDNRLAALRILDFQPLDGPTVIAAPLLQANRLERNLLDEPVHGLYRAADEVHRQ